MADIEHCSTDEDEKNHAEAQALLQSLLTRAGTLLEELEAFEAELKVHAKQHAVDIAYFKRNVKSEVKGLNSVSAKGDGTVGKLNPHVLKSSNLPFFEAVWHTARARTGVVAVSKKMYWTPKTTEAQNLPRVTSTTAKPVHRKVDLQSIMIDVVADHGQEWIKVSTVTSNRLLLEIAKQGWEVYGGASDSEAEDTHDQASVKSSSQDYKLDLIKQAEAFRVAMLAHRIWFHHPKVKFVFPKIEEGLDSDVDAILADIRNLGIDVCCGNDMSESILTDSNHELGRKIPVARFHSMRPTAARGRLTPSLNIDCTILLALISDISHVRREDLPPSPKNWSQTYHNAILRQIETENQFPLLPSQLYGVLKNRKLVCTAATAQRMTEIVATMGMETERERAAVWFGQSHFRSHVPAELREALRRLSVHAVPSDLQLPIQIVDFDLPMQTSMRAHDPASTISAFEDEIATAMQQHLDLSAINHSVILYGWSRGITTITSNRDVTNKMIKVIGTLLDEHEQRTGTVVGRADFHGPQTWVCDTARSLVGKEKQSSTGGVQQQLKRILFNGPNGSALAGQQSGTSSSA